MRGSDDDGDPGRREAFRREIDARERRKLEARRGRFDPLWVGLGMFGLVGWAVAIPTLVGLAIGRWLDARVEGPVSWTITLLAVGVALGCINAWWWVSRKSREE